MPLYRKKPVEVEARLLEPETVADIEAWIGMPLDRCYAATGGGLVTAHPGNPPDLRGFSPPLDAEPVGVVIPTLEGRMAALWYSYIVRGVKGEFYPCQPDIFAATYEPVSARPGAGKGETT